MGEVGLGINHLEKVINRLHSGEEGSEVGVRAEDQASWPWERLNVGSVRSDCL